MFATTVVTTVQTGNYCFIELKKAAYWYIFAQNMSDARFTKERDKQKYTRYTRNNTPGSASNQGLRHLVTLNLYTRSLQKGRRIISFHVAPNNNCRFGPGQCIVAGFEALQRLL